MIKVKNTKVIECWDWDELVSKTYGRPYCLQQQDGCKERGGVRLVVPAKAYDEHMHDEIPEYINGLTIGVKFKTWLDRDPEYNAFEHKYENDLFWERSFYPDMQTVANDLHEKGLIEEGEYTIEIDW